MAGTTFGVALVRRLLAALAGVRASFGGMRALGRVVTRLAAILAATTGCAINQWTSFVVIVRRCVGVGSALLFSNSVTFMANLHPQIVDRYNQGGRSRRANARTTKGQSTADLKELRGSCEHLGCGWSNRLPWTTKHAETILLRATATQRSHLQVAHDRTLDMLPPAPDTTQNHIDNQKPNRHTLAWSTNSICASNALRSSE